MWTSAGKQVGGVLARTPAGLTPLLKGLRNGEKEWEERGGRAWEGGMERVWDSSMGQLFLQSQ